MSTVMDEVLLICPFDGLTYITNLLVTFSRFMSMNTGYFNGRPDRLELLRKRPIFPIRTPNTGTYLEFESLKAAKEDDLWFIADRTQLRRCFEGTVALLVIETSSLASLQELINLLHLDSRLLSRVVSGVPRLEGNAEVDNELTAEMRRKAPFISR
jgi:hypothetical protein